METHETKIFFWEALWLMSFVTGPLNGKNVSQVLDVLAGISLENEGNRYSFLAYLPTRNGDK